MLGYKIRARSLRGDAASDGARIDELIG